MRIGLVKHSNARPLTFGIEKSGEHSLVYENPSVLKDLLLEGKLDTALISSVECIRNKSLSCTTCVGVAAAEKVRSILFFRNRKMKNTEKIYTDHGSRSSVALLKILIAETEGKLPETEPTLPEKIQEMIHNGEGHHLLFGDNALRADWDPEKYEALDLASFWHSFTQKSFCFAFWAYPKENPVDESLFLSSLEYGLSHIDDIVNEEKKLDKKMLDHYLRHELHYKINQSDLEGFELFKELLKKHRLD